MTILAFTPTKATELAKQQFNRHQLLPLQSDTLWCIQRGVVRILTWNAEGTPIALGYWREGDVVGYPLSRMQPYEIHCCTSVEASILPKELWQQALDAIMRHGQQMEELLSIVHQQPVAQRLWQFLIFLGNKFGRDVEQERQIDLPISHQEIAEAIGTTRVSVTRMLQQFEIEGRLRRDKRRIILCQGIDSFSQQ